MAPMVVIQHPKTGETYAVTLADYHRAKVYNGDTYEAAGFKVQGYEDGTPYEPPTPKVDKPKTEKPVEPTP